MTNRQQEQDRLVKDTLILQKVNAANREAFTQRFPGQSEHIMRLIAERLQAVLANKPQSLSDPATWTATTSEINDLSQALLAVHEIYKDLHKK